MYSLVLATMLTAGTAGAPAWGCHGCWGGCHGCCGGCYGCYGCCGGCYGCYGCCGGCYGCWGGCYGCSGCYGCWGCSGCYGCWGGGYYPSHAYYDCYGCWGCHGCYGSVVIQPVYVAPPPAAKPEEKKKAAANQATVIVQLPADARLTVDGKGADLTSATRSFITPALEMDRDYYYTIKAEADRDGRALTQTKRVLVRAGQVSRVDFGDLTSAEAVKVTREASPAPARITVRLPEKADLYVDDVLCPQKDSAERSFETPTLEPGRTYHYALRVELVRDGRTVKEDRRIDMRAGKKIDVDFTDMGTIATSR